MKRKERCRPWRTINCIDDPLSARPAFGFPGDEAEFVPCIGIAPTCAALAELVYDTAKEIGWLAQLGHFSATGSADAVAERPVDPGAADCRIQAQIIETRLLGGLAKVGHRKQNQVTRRI